MCSTSALPEPRAVLDVDRGDIFNPPRRKKKKPEKKVPLFVLAASRLGRRVRDGLAAGEAWSGRLVRPRREPGGTSAALLRHRKGPGGCGLGLSPAPCAAWGTFPTPHPGSLSLQPPVRVGMLILGASCLV